MSKAKISYDINTIKTMSMFENLTRTAPRDCFTSNGTLYFVVQPEEMGRAIGKNGQNIKRIEQMMNRKIKVLEYSPDMAAFIRNLIHPITAKQISAEGGKIIITGHDTKTKGMLIGRNAANLKSYTEIARRYFDIDEIRVI